MYRPTIGLEIHAELNTRTKMFCSCANDADESRPNVNVCPVCLAHPGTLPVINREAVRHILRVGTAVGGTLARQCEFDRKSYFYPDIPKGYQISQYKRPLVQGGMLSGVAITRVHLEEDTARSVHEGGVSKIDFNRAGIPLMELVTEPVIADAETAGAFARELQLLLRALGAGKANLEKGEMRIEANVSVIKPQAGNVREYGVKVEVKNLNSFRSVERAIAYEIGRQSSLIDSGATVVQETRGWDEAKQQTFHQRFKEGSADYRYFPEPDLPEMYPPEIAEFSAGALASSLPELPWNRRIRYATIGLKESDIEFIMAENSRAIFFDSVLDEIIGEKKLIGLASNYFVSDLAGEHGNVTPVAFAKLLQMYERGELSSRGAKDTLSLLVENGGDPKSLAKEHNLIQIHDTSALESIVQAMLEREDKAVTEYKAGKQTALQYLIGKAMQGSNGAGNPNIFKTLIQNKLK